MQAIYIILGALAVLIPGFFVVSLFLPATVKVVHTRVIKAPLSIIYQQISTPGNWEQWCPWRAKNMAITESKTDEYVAMNLRQHKARSSFRIERGMNGTIITWKLVAEIGHNPGSKLIAWWMDRRIKKDFKRGMTNLETVVKGLS
jgi:hypothetical protein